jgi:flagellar transcriptional activator FlhD
MSGLTLQDEIREINLAYLMLAQRMLREDRESAMFRLGVGSDVAALILGLSSTQLVKLAASQMLLPRLRFDDTLLLGLLAGQGKDAASSGLHAAILATARPVASRA